MKFEKQLNSIDRNLSKDDTILFAEPLAITDDSFQWNNTRYDIQSLDISTYDGLVTADHGSNLKDVIGKVINLRKEKNKVLIDGIKFAVRENPIAILAKNLMSSGFVTGVSIETMGGDPDNTNTWRNHQLCGLSVVAHPNNRNAYAVIANSINESRAAGLDTNELENLQLNHNPYHDELGRFTTGPSATFGRVFSSELYVDPKDVFEFQQTYVRTSLTNEQRRAIDYGAGQLSIEGQLDGTVKRAYTVEGKYKELIRKGETLTDVSNAQYRKMHNIMVETSAVLPGKKTPAERRRQRAELKKLLHQVETLESNKKQLRDALKKLPESSFPKLDSFSYTRNDPRRGKTAKDLVIEAANKQIAATVTLRHMIKDVQESRARTAVSIERLEYYTETSKTKFMPSQLEYGESRYWFEPRY